MFFGCMIFTVMVNGTFWRLRFIELRFFLGSVIFIIMGNGNAWIRIVELSPSTMNNIYGYGK